MIALKKPGRERRRFELHANALAFGLLAKEGVLANRRFEMFEMTTSGEIWVTVDNIPLTRARVASPRICELIPVLRARSSVDVQRALARGRRPAS